MPRNKYPEETVQKILDASLELFMTKGYEQTTVLDIVNNMGGLTRGAFYHHFKSKEEVLDALGTRMYFDNNPFDEVKKETGLTGLQKIKEIMRLQFENQEWEKINIASIPLLENPRFLAKQVKDIQDFTAPLVRELIEEGVSDGSIQTSYPKQLSELGLIITNLWLIPSVFPCTRKELMDKLLFSKEILDAIGLPIFDEEIVNSLRDLMDKIGLE